MRAKGRLRRAGGEGPGAKGLGRGAGVVVPRAKGRGRRRRVGGKAPGARGEDKLEGLTVADLKRQQAANNLKTTGDEDMESKEEDEGGTSPVEKN